MRGKNFMNAVANGEEDILEVFLDILKRTKAAYCTVGGLAVPRKRDDPLDDRPGGSHGSCRIEEIGLLVPELP